MMHRLRTGALSLVLVVCAVLAAIGIFMPWEDGVNQTDGVRTYGGMVLPIVPIIGVLALLRLIGSAPPNVFDVPMLVAALFALAIMLVFYVVQIGRMDSRIADSTRAVEAGDGFFLTLAGLVALAATVAAHYISYRAHIRTEGTHADG